MLHAAHVKLDLQAVFLQPHYLEKLEEYSNDEVLSAMCSSIVAVVERFAESHMLLAFSFQIHVKRYFRTLLLKVIYIA